MLGCSSFVLWILRFSLPVGRRIQNSSEGEQNQGLISIFGNFIIHKIMGKKASVFLLPKTLRILLYARPSFSQFWDSRSLSVAEFKIRAKERLIKDYIQFWFFLEDARKVLNGNNNNKGRQTRIFFVKILLTKVKSTLRMDFPSAFDLPPILLLPKLLRNSTSCLRN